MFARDVNKNIDGWIRNEVSKGELVLPNVPNLKILLKEIGGEISSARGDVNALKSDNNLFGNPNHDEDDEVEKSKVAKWKRVRENLVHIAKYERVIVDRLRTEALSAAKKIRMNLLYTFFQLYLASPDLFNGDSALARARVDMLDTKIRGEKNALTGEVDGTKIEQDHDILEFLKKFRSMVIPKDWVLEFCVLADQVVGEFGTSVTDAGISAASVSADDSGQQYLETPAQAALKLATIVGATAKRRLIFDALYETKEEAAKLPKMCSQAWLEKHKLFRRDMTAKIQGIGAFSLEQFVTALAVQVEKIGFKPDLDADSKRSIAIANLDIIRRYVADKDESVEEDKDLERIYLKKERRVVGLGSRELDALLRKLKVVGGGLMKSSSSGGISHTSSDGEEKIHPKDRSVLKKIMQVFWHLASRGNKSPGLGLPTEVILELFSFVGAYHWRVLEVQKIGAKKYLEHQAAEQNPLNTEALRKAAREETDNAELFPADAALTILNRVSKHESFQPLEFLTQTVRDLIHRFVDDRFFWSPGSKAAGGGRRGGTAGRVGGGPGVSGAGGGTQEEEDELPFESLPFEDAADKLPQGTIPLSYSKMAAELILRSAQEIFGSTRSAPPSDKQIAPFLLPSFQLFLAMGLLSQNIGTRLSCLNTAKLLAEAPRIGITDKILLSPEFLTRLLYLVSMDKEYTETLAKKSRLGNLFVNANSGNIPKPQLRRAMILARATLSTLIDSYSRESVSFLGSPEDVLTLFAGGGIGGVGVTEMGESAGLVSIAISKGTPGQNDPLSKTLLTGRFAQRVMKQASENFMVPPQVIQIFREIKILEVLASGSTLIAPDSNAKSGAAALSIAPLYAYNTVSELMFVTKKRRNDTAVGYNRSCPEDPTNFFEQVFDFKHLVNFNVWAVLEREIPKLPNYAEALLLGRSIGSGFDQIEGAGASRSGAGCALSARGKELFELFRADKIADQQFARSFAIKHVEQLPDALQALDLGQEWIERSGDVAGERLINRQVCRAACRRAEAGGMASWWRRDGSAPPAGETPAGEARGEEVAPSLCYAVEFDAKNPYSPSCTLILGPPRNPLLAAAGKNLVRFSTHEAHKNAAMFDLSPSHSGSSDKVECWERTEISRPGEKSNDIDDSGAKAASTYLLSVTTMVPLDARRRGGSSFGSNSVSEKDLHPIMRHIVSVLDNYENHKVIVDEAEDEEVKLCKAILGEETYTKIGYNNPDKIDVFLDPLSIFNAALQESETGISSHPVKQVTASAAAIRILALLVRKGYPLPAPIIDRLARISKTYDDEVAVLAAEEKMYTAAAKTRVFTAVSKVVLTAAVAQHAGEDHPNTTIPQLPASLLGKNSPLPSPKLKSVARYQPQVFDIFDRMLQNQIEKRGSSSSSGNASSSSSDEFPVALTPPVLKSLASRLYVLPPLLGESKKLAGEKLHAAIQVGLRIDDVEDPNIGFFRSVEEIKNSDLLKSLSGADADEKRAALAQSLHDLVSNGDKFMAIWDAVVETDLAEHTARRMAAFATLTKALTLDLQLLREAKSEAEVFAKLAGVNSASRGIPPRNRDRGTFVLDRSIAKAAEERLARIAAHVKSYRSLVEVEGVCLSLVLNETINAVGEENVDMVGPDLDLKDLKALLTELEDQGNAELLTSGEITTSVLQQVLRESASYAQEGMALLEKILQLSTTSIKDDVDPSSSTTTSKRIAPSLDLGPRGLPATCLAYVESNVEKLLLAPKKNDLLGESSYTPPKPGDHVVVPDWSSENGGLQAEVVALVEDDLGPQGVPRIVVQLPLEDPTNPAAKRGDVVVDRTFPLPASEASSEESWKRIKKNMRDVASLVSVLEQLVEQSQNGKDCPQCVVVNRQISRLAEEFLGGQLGQVLEKNFPFPPTKTPVPTPESFQASFDIFSFSVPENQPPISVFYRLHQLLTSAFIDKNFTLPPLAEKTLNQLWRLRVQTNYPTDDSDIRVWPDENWEAFPIGEGARRVNRHFPLLVNRHLHREASMVDADAMMEQEPFSALPPLLQVLGKIHRDLALPLFSAEFSSGGLIEQEHTEVLLSEGISCFSSTECVFDEEDSDFKRAVATMQRLSSSSATFRRVLLSGGGLGWTQKALLEAAKENWEKQLEAEVLFSAGAGAGEVGVQATISLEAGIAGTEEKSCPRFKRVDSWWNPAGLNFLLDGRVRNLVFQEFFSFPAILLLPWEARSSSSREAKVLI